MIILLRGGCNIYWYVFILIRKKSLTDVSNKIYRVAAHHLFGVEAPGETIFSGLISFVGKLLLISIWDHMGSGVIQKQSLKAFHNFYCIFLQDASLKNVSNKMEISCFCLPFCSFCIEPPLKSNRMVKIKKSELLVLILGYLCFDVCSKKLQTDSEDMSCSLYCHIVPNTKRSSS